jgi:hypothetical protein
MSAYNFLPPALAIDGVLYSTRHMSTRAKLERRVVWNLIRHLHAAGFRVVSVQDDDGLERVRGAKSAMERIFSLDDCDINFKRGERTYWVRVVLGNNGWDTISDYLNNIEFAAIIDSLQTLIESVEGC